jgi:hypothetical protein
MFRSEVPVRRRTRHPTRSRRRPPAISPDGMVSSLHVHRVPSKRTGEVSPSVRHDPLQAQDPEIGFLGKRDSRLTAAVIHHRPTGRAASAQVPVSSSKCVNGSHRRHSFVNWPPSQTVLAQFPAQSRHASNSERADGMGGLDMMVLEPKGASCGLAEAMASTDGDRRHGSDCWMMSHGVFFALIVGNCGSER